MRDAMTVGTVHGKAKRLIKPYLTVHGHILRLYMLVPRPDHPLSAVPSALPPGPHTPSRPPHPESPSRAAASREPRDFSRPTGAPAPLIKPLTFVNMNKLDYSREAAATTWATTAFSQAISLYLPISHPYLPISRRPPPSLRPCSSAALARSPLPRCPLPIPYPYPYPYPCPALPLPLPLPRLRAVSLLVATIVP